MSTQNTEYLPDPSEHQNGDGHSNGNGNGHVKPFTLKPGIDPDTLAILDARDTALQDRRLNRSMRAFFCFIIDRALNPRWYDCKGVVCMADSIPAEVFSCTARTIYDWKQRLEDCGYVWLSKKGKPNMWPLTVYHLSCLHRQLNAGKTDPDGTYGRGKVRHAPGDELAADGRAQRNAALAAKRAQRTLPLAGGVAVLPGSPGGEGEGKTTDLKGISALTRKKLRPSAEMNFGSEPKTISAGSRKQFRLPAEMNFGSEPKPISADSRNPLPLTAEADCQHIETQKEVESPRDLTKAVNRLGNRLKDVPAGKNPESEREFVAYCQELFRTAKTSEGKPEWASNGGLWVTCFRQNKRKAWAVMHELKTMKVERPGTIKKTLGAVAMDLWKNNRVGA